jgi:NAD(P)-dependent dehydrogenase (short-subunit alcohol dehydrogenase family)
MELEGRIAVITHGLNERGIALATGLLKCGARVILSDRNERRLVSKAEEIGAVPVPASISNSAEIKCFIDRITKRFGRIDLFAVNTSFSKNVIAEKHDSLRLHADVMSQMYVAKYVLPQMIRRGSGYLINTVPFTGLLNECRSEMYSTLKHPALSFAERIAAAYGSAGIKISVLCVDNEMTFNNNCFSSGEYDPVVLQDQAALILKGILHEQFMIFLQSKKNEIPCQEELARYELYKHIHA